MKALLEIINAGFFIYLLIFLVVSFVAIGELVFYNEKTEKLWDIGAKMSVILMVLVVVMIILNSTIS
jgi:hypothetical protein